MRAYGAATLRRFHHGLIVLLFAVSVQAAPPADRAQVRETWAKIIGPFPQRVPLNAKVLKTEPQSDHTRILVQYQSDPVWQNEAYILVPKDEKQSHPGAVVLHATSARTIDDPVGLGGRESVHMALELVRRGYVCIAPRNFLWRFKGKNYEKAAAEILKQSPWKTGMAKMTWDAIRATDLLLEQPGVDPDRIVSIGHSLGGKEALYHAAFDERVKVAVSCEGGISIRFSNWDAPWYLGPQVKAETFKHDHDELISLIAPRALMVIGGESADGAKSQPFIDANLPLWKSLGAGGRLKLLKHNHGHDFPPVQAERDAVYEWIAMQLR